MTHPLHWMAAAALTLTLAPATTAIDDETYTVKLTRPFHVGQKMRIRCDGLQDRVTSMIKNGIPQGTDESTISVMFDAIAQVDAVDPAGQPTRITYTVTRFVVDRGEELTPVAPPGATVVTRVQNGQTTFEVNGVPVTNPDDQTAMRMVASLPMGGNDDAVFGSPMPRRAGDAWSINVDKAVNDLAIQGHRKVRSGDVSGTTTLVGVTNERGHECLVVQQNVRTDNLSTSMLPVPAGYEVLNTTITTNVEGTYPIEITIPPLRQSVDMTLTATMTGPVGRSGETGEIRFVSTRTVQRQITLLSTAVTTGAEPSGTPY